VGKTKHAQYRETPASKSCPVLAATTMQLAIIWAARNASLTGIAFNTRNGDATKPTYSPGRFRRTILAISPDSIRKKFTGKELIENSLSGRAYLSRVKPVIRVP